MICSFRSSSSRVLAPGVHLSVMTVDPNFSTTPNAGETEKGEWGAASHRNSARELPGLETVSFSVVKKSSVSWE